MDTRTLETLTSTIDGRRDLRRSTVDLLIQRSEHVSPDERAIIHAVYRVGMTMAEVAAIQGVRASTLRRRVKRVCRRMMGPRFVFVLANRANWSDTRRRVAEDTILRGHPIRRVSSGYSTLHIVRKERAAIEALFMDHVARGGAPRQ
jgi:IS30 family transposase